MKHHEWLWGSALLVFIVWVLIAPSSEMRIVRVCRPIHWADSGIVSLTALTAPKYESEAQNMGNRVEYGCEYSVWRLFFQEKYDAWIEARRKAEDMAHGVAHCAAAAVKGAAGSASDAADAAHPTCTAANPILSQPRE